MTSSESTGLEDASPESAVAPDAITSGSIASDPIATGSRAVSRAQDCFPGCVFYLLPPKKVQLQDMKIYTVFVEEAISLGASTVVAPAIVCNQMQPHYPQINFIPCPNPRASYAQDCRRASGYQHKSPLVGITGTKGKTSLAYMLNSIVGKSGYIGTLGVYFDQEFLFENQGSLTCPPPEELYQKLAKLDSLDAKLIALEYTSIACDAFRCIDTFDLGIMTNFTGDDHLIYHTTTENYLACKLMLLDQCDKFLAHSSLLDKLPTTDKRIHSYDVIPEGQNLENKHTFVMKYMTNLDGFYVSFWSKNNQKSDHFTHNYEKIYEGQVALLGKFQLDNLAGAMAAAHMLGHEIAQAMGKLGCTKEDQGSARSHAPSRQPQADTDAKCGSNFNCDPSKNPYLGASCGTDSAPSHTLNKTPSSPPVIPSPYNVGAEPAHHSCCALNAPGRMEIIATVGSNKVVLDYAHTPNSLKAALSALKEQGFQKIIAIFGCGGRRDTQKRQIMGEIAHQLADEVIVTDDNPRNEDPAKIREMICTGCTGAHNVEGRAAAIKLGLDLLKKYENSALLVAGKGHEEYQIVYDKVLEKEVYVPFSDKKTVLELINKTDPTT